MFNIVKERVGNIFDWYTIQHNKHTMLQKTKINRLASQLKLATRTLKKTVNSDNES